MSNRTKHEWRRNSLQRAKVAVRELKDMFTTLLDRASFPIRYAKAMPLLSITQNSTLNKQLVLLDTSVPTTQHRLYTAPMLTTP